MTPRRVAILGLGLMGGSLGLALRALADPPRVAGFDLRPQVSRRARERGAVDEDLASPGEAVGDAELVFLAVPPLTVAALIDALEHDLPGTALIADLSSVMRPLHDRLNGRPGLSRRAVSSHPLCGSERDGIEAAQEDLYRGHAVLIGAGEAAGEAAERVSTLWREVGAVPRPIDPLAHDALLALTSHLPYLGSVALVRALKASGRPAGSLGAVSGPGLRDASRLAGSLPALWEEILTLNADQLAPALKLLESEIARLRKALESGEPGLGILLDEAAVYREGLSR